MTVDGIYDSFHNSYGVQQIQTTYATEPDKVGRQIDEADVSKQAEITEQSGNLTSVAEPAQENQASRMADLESVSLKFNKEDSFGYIGMDSSLDNLDMQKAISDMRKDQVLQNYQYFVGSAGSLFGEMPSEDGMVVMKP